MNWGKSIVLAFVLFALFIGTLVVICLRQDIPLVATDYYEQELRYQEQLERLNNTNALTEKPVLTIINGGLEIRYNRLTDIVNGELELFRPSDERFDRRFSVKAEGTVQRFELAELPGGMYKARLRWAQDGREYFLESTIYL